MSTLGTCCWCGYSGGLHEVDEACPKSVDGDGHCDCWWSGPHLSIADRLQRAERRWMALREELTAAVQLRDLWLAESRPYAGDLAGERDGLRAALSLMAKVEGMEARRD